MSRNFSPGLQHQLAADMVELGFLRLRQRHVGVAVVGAGVHPARIEPQARRNRRTRRSGTGPAARPCAANGPPRFGAAQHLRPPAGVAAHRRARQQARRHRHEVAHAAFQLDPAFDEILGHAADLARRHRGQARPVLERQRDGRRRRSHALAGGQLHAPPAPAGRPAATRSCEEVCPCANSYHSRRSQSTDVRVGRFRSRTIELIRMAPAGRCPVDTDLFRLKLFSE